MTANRTCPECQSPLPDDAPAGLCPRCLLQRGLGSDTSGQTAAYAGFTPPSVDELRPLFPQLEIIELLGHGGMGAVYKARQPGLDRLVALKILPQRDDAAFAERFTREARALARLSHPGIVTVHDFGQAGGLYYFVMEYVEGVNLRQAERAGKLTPAESLAIVPQICAALQFAHDAGVVHRDIKPENILLDAKGRVKIADFGLAKLRGGEGPNPLTHTNQVMGTIHYMAPEQWEKPQSVDHRADIYSLGVVFYELLTGELPLGRFAPPSQKVQVDVRIDDIVLRTLEKEPDRRYQHASDVKTDVEKLTAEAFDKLTLEEAKATAAKLRERQAELKATRQRLGERMGTLIGDDLRREMSKSRDRWRQMPRWRRYTFWTVLILVVVLFAVGMVGSAYEDANGLSLANSHLVLAVLIGLPLATVPLAIATTSNRRKAAALGERNAAPKPVGKLGCSLLLINSVAMTILLGVSLLTNNTTVRIVANSILVADVSGSFVWQLFGWIRSRRQLLKSDEADHLKDQTDDPEQVDDTKPAPPLATPMSASRTFFRHVVLPFCLLYVVWLSILILVSVATTGWSTGGLMECCYVGLYGLTAVAPMLCWRWQARRRVRLFLRILRTGFAAMIGLAISGITVQFIPSIVRDIARQAQQQQLVGIWTWIDGRVGTSEFRADGTFEERFRERVPDVKPGEPIDPANQELVERDGMVRGQYRWDDWARDDKVIVVLTPGKAERRLTVVITGNDLTLKEADGGVHRMTRIK